jgi:hypothetical protein
MWRRRVTGVLAMTVRSRDAGRGSRGTIRVVRTSRRSSTPAARSTVSRRPATSAGRSIKLRPPEQRPSTYAANPSPTSDGAAGGRGSPIGRGDPGFSQLRRWTGRSATVAGRLANCHQPRSVHRWRRGGRAPPASRAWVACACRSVMRWVASAWLSPACWLCMALTFSQRSAACCTAGTGYCAGSGCSSGRGARIWHVP